MGWLLNLAQTTFGKYRSSSQLRASELAFPLPLAPQITQVSAKVLPPERCPPWQSNLSNWCHSALTHLPSSLAFICTPPHAKLFYECICFFVYCLSSPNKNTKVLRGRTHQACSPGIPQHLRWHHTHSGSSVNGRLHSRCHGDTYVIRYRSEP